MMWNQEGSNPLISIIVPVYNVALYLREAVESIINQSYKDLQIILVNDGSSDGSGTICDEYKTDPRITVIHQEHQGPSIARNIGLDSAIGEYVAFLDSDDAYGLSFIQIMLETACRENADIVACKYYMVQDDKGKSISAAKNGIFPIPKAGAYNRKDALCALVNGTINGEIWNKLYARVLWENNRFPLEYDVAEDVIASYSVFDLCNKVYVIDQPLYFHRMRKGSLSSTYTEKFVHNRILAPSHVKKYIEEHIPEIFSEEHLIHYKQSKLRSAIAQFARVDDRKLSPKITDYVITTVKEIGIANCSFDVRLGYYMLRFCPWLVKILFPFCYQIRYWVKRVKG